MTVDELRAEETSICSQLAVVRGELATAVANLAGATRAKEQIAAEDGPNDGVYRKPADERLGNLRERAAMRLPAESDRERLRAQESTLLIALEQNRNALIEHGVRRVTLPALTNIPNAAPCAMRWEDMTGDGDERVCTKCHKIARNIALSENVDAKTFLTDPNAPFHRRADGTILAGNCVEGERNQRTNRLMIAVLGAVAVGLVGVLVVFSLRSNESPNPPPSTAPNLFPAPSSSELIDPTTSTQMNIHGVWGINIRDTARDHGKKREFWSSLTTRANEYVTSVSCGPDAHAVSAVIPADSVQRFFDAINKRRTSPDTMIISCPDPDLMRDINIRIVDGGSVLTLTVRNCSRQWFANDVPINLDPADPMDDGEVNARYDDMLHVLPVDKCFAEVADAGESAPPPSVRRP